MENNSNLLIDPIRREKEYKELLTEALAQGKSKNPYPMLVTSMTDGARAAFYAAVSSDWKLKTGGRVLIILPDESECFLASKIFTELGMNATMYPSREFSFGRINASHSYEHERLSVLDKAMNGDADVFITSPEAALQYTVPQEKLKKKTFTLRVGTEMPIEQLVLRLDGLGYVRADMVEGEGQFSVRGGICDIFPPKNEHPVRVEFFGDEIDRIAEFDILSQRAVSAPDELVFTQGREVVCGKEEKEILLSVIDTQIKKAKNDKAISELRAEREAVATGTDAVFIDKYISCIYPERECFLDYFGKDTLVIVRELNAVNDALKAVDFRNNEMSESLISAEKILGAYADYSKCGSALNDFLSARATVYCNTFTSNIERLSGIYSVKSKQGVSYRDNMPLLLEDLDFYISNGYKINILTENDTVSKKMCEMLLDSGISSEINSEPSVGIPNFVSGINLPGYELSTSKYVCLSMYASVFSAGRVINTRRKKKAKSAKDRIDSYTELQIGDYVVHENHGVGRYLGLQTVTMNGITNDYVKLQYSGDGCVYLPCTQLDMLSKYLGSGVETGTVKLSKIGGAEWGKAKLKAKTSAKAMAKELIELYAERMRREGIAFDTDDAMQQEFESAFEYEETDAQLEAAREIKDDMEKSVPMERLLCGDVGYGKTEVALRAAFKAVRSGYQVALLVPTTILALQHYQTILARMRGFPVTVDMVSRFRKPKEQRETVKRLKRGETDILVGTHRLLSKDIEFKSLGLVIIDEEQRFGVAQKEKLKQLSKDVDVLTLTATPIPRTLNMALSGIRDMSVLDEPPIDRIPVQTYVLEYDEAIISDAIKRELRRGGQIFYLHNRVETLDDIAAHLAQIAPDAVVAVAHGQMDKEELSDIWKSMLEGETDILVCTTLIESGVDIPNANTLIIDDAHRYGLAQLHQIRGRVGRSGRRAYAYLTYRRGMSLTEIAQKRLEAIRDFTEFGSGFRVAMRDMEIRGTGNLLGSEQHGQIESVGYDLYMKLLNDAVLEEKGELPVKRRECTVSLQTDAYLPERYIRSSAQRIDAYKRIASVSNEEDMYDVYDELADRYGALPKQANVLLNISLIRALGSEAGFDKIDYRNGALLFFAGSFDVNAIRALTADMPSRIKFSFGNTPYMTLKLKNEAERCDEAIDLLKKYIQITEQKL